MLELSLPSFEYKVKKQNGALMIFDIIRKKYVVLTPEEWATMKDDRAKCLGCLSQCQFSSWSGANGTTGKIYDPRTYCIHKTLFDISHNGKTDDNLLFAGHQVYRFGQDPLYANGHIPTTHELIEAIKAGR